MKEYKEFYRLASSHGDKIPCRSPQFNSNYWTSDNPTEQLEASAICAKCPIFKECGQIGSKEQGGIWGGKERTIVTYRNEQRRISNSKKNTRAKILEN